MSNLGQKLKIVVSYRRTDAAMAGRIFDRLAQRFGANNVFIDIDNIPFGVDFRKHIDDELGACDLMVAIVGPKWLGPRDDGTFRIMNEADPVRVELETALKREIPILPVLLEGASMPSTGDLPDSLKEFAYRNAMEAESGRDFNVHVERLIRAIERILGPQPGPVPLPRPRPDDAKRGLRLVVTGLAGVLLVAMLAAGTWYFIRGGDVSRLSGVQTADHAPFCEVFRRIVAEAATSFSSITGPKSGEVWLARVQLPGFIDCRISEYKTTRYYVCSLPPVDSLDEVKSQQSSRALDLNACLGDAWFERRIRVEDNVETVTFVAGDDQPIIAIRILEFAAHKEWEISLTVDAPATATPPSAQKSPTATATPPPSN